ncbi:MAG: 6-phosphofructokinase [Oscillospiraceae bacterium]|nr:6-phosphofructokinase [Oscillospiraceae bacterium]
MEKRKIGILTSGGDCPALNAAMRGLILACNQLMGADNVEFIGILNGFHGLINNQVRKLEGADFDGLLTKGGTFLGSKRTPFKMMQVVEEDGVDKVAKMKETYNALGLSCFVTLGGNGTHKNANLLSSEGLNVIAMPKTIDNDIPGTDVTFGFHTAVEIGAEALDRIRTTARSHNRVIVVEVMGNKSGCLSLYAGMGAGADVILIPEIPYTYELLFEAISRKTAAEGHAIVVVAEGALDSVEAALPKLEREKKRLDSGERTVTERLTKLIQEKTGAESRSVVLGHMLRGGTPSGYDRVLATQFGSRAAFLIQSNMYGYTVAKKGNVVMENKLADIVGKPRRVDVSSPVVKAARSVGISFGD